jgi:hypothetical protein
MPFRPSIFQRQVDQSKLFFFFACVLLDNQIRDVILEISFGFTDAIATKLI